MLNRLMLVIVALVALCGLAGCGANRLVGPDAGLGARARQAGGYNIRQGVVLMPVHGEVGAGGSIDPYRIPDDQDQ